MFDDLIAANARYAETFDGRGLRGTAARHLAVVTCIDSRIAPLAMLGLQPGDAKIIRNAGARITKDAIRSLILAVNLLEVTRVCIVQHTDCAMARRTQDEVTELIEQRTGVGQIDIDFLTMDDQEAALREDLARLRDHPLLPPELDLGGFVFDVHTGRLRLVTI